MFKMNHNLNVDLNLVRQLKEVREYWNQDTAIAAKKRKEFLDNAMKVGGTVLVVYLVGYLKGIRTGVGYGNINIELFSDKER